MFAFGVRFEKRNRGEIEFQMLGENLKLKEMSMQLESFDMANAVKQESLASRYKDSIRELNEQKQRFMDQLQQVMYINCQEEGWKC